jgi:hypothetical protein
VDVSLNEVLVMHTSLIAIVLFTVPCAQPSRHDNWWSANFEIYQINENGTYDEAVFLSQMLYQPFFDVTHDMLARHAAGEKLLLRCQAVVPIEELHNQRRARYERNQIESRAIVTRKCNTQTPTWDGKEPAFVFEPSLWHFDPELDITRVKLIEVAVGPNQPLTQLIWYGDPSIHPRHYYLELWDPDGNPECEDGLRYHLRTGWDQ